VESGSVAVTPLVSSEDKGSTGAGGAIWSGLTRAMADGTDTHLLSRRLTRHLKTKKIQNFPSLH
jgi:hypothetical protein